MRVATVALSFAIIFPNPLPASPHLNRTPQQASTTSSTATIALQQSLFALAPNVALNDVTLTGTVRRIAGADDETGTGTFKATSSGASRIDLSLPSGQLSEIVNASVNPAVGSWVGPDGVSHPLSLHNLLTDSSWFFPALSISRWISSTGTVTAYVGLEALNGQSALHLSVSHPTAGAKGNTAALLARLSQMELYLDPGTNLPVALFFNSHPDDDADTNIPTQILFSGYRSINGVQVPSHVQKFLNNSLVFDFQMQSTTINSGLSASEFSIQ